MKSFRYLSLSWYQQAAPTLTLALGQGQEGLKQAKEFSIPVTY